MKIKKAVLGICAAAIIALAAVNVNLAMNGGCFSNLTLENIVSLARGEHGNCPVCGGENFDGCTCVGDTISCDRYCSFTAQCWWSITVFPNPLYPCYFSGKRGDRCIGQCP